MATIVTRAGKGSALTFVEGDANFTNLNTDKIEAVADDAAPQLGGDLDVNDNKITTTVTNGNIVVEANGTGAIKIKNPLEVNITDSGTTGFKFETNQYNDAVISTTGTTQWIVLQPNTGGGTWIEGNAKVAGDLEVRAGGDLIVKSGNITNNTTDGNITLLPNGAGQIILDGNSVVQNGAFSVDSLIQSALGSDLILASDANAGGMGAYIVLGATGGFNFVSNSSFVIDGIAYPNTDGTAGQALTTDGAGNLSFNDLPAAGISAVVDDTTPQLGGNLDVNNFAITTTVTDGNIVLAPNGAGVVELGGDALSGYDGAVVVKPGATDGNGIIVTETGIDMAIAADAASGLGGIIQLFAAGGIELASNGSTTIDGIAYPNADGTAGQFITTDGAGALGFTSTLEGAGLVDYREAPYALTYASTITPDAANGNVQIVTLTGNVTMNALGNPVAGQSITLIVKQDATGSRTLTSSMKFAGGEKTLTTAANSIDIITIFYDGTNYWASLGKDFK